MKIRMLETVRGSPDGGTVLVYKKGCEYDLSGTERERELAEVFLRHGRAEKVKPPEAKAIPVAPENKDLGAAPDDKSPAFGKRKH